MKTKSFESLTLENLDPLYRYALRLARGPEMAEDLVQETFSKVFAHRKRLSKIEGLRPMMFRILHNLYIDQWRAMQRKPAMISFDQLSEEGVAFESSAPNPCEELIRGALSDEVTAALAELDGEMRQTLWLRDVEKFSYMEISEIMDTPIGTVRSRLSRARRAMADRLEQYAIQRGVIPRTSEHHGG